MTPTLFYSWLESLLAARSALDGIQLQRLEANITDDYKAHRLPDFEYRTLMRVCSIFMDDYRKTLAK